MATFKRAGAQPSPTVPRGSHRSELKQGSRFLLEDTAAL
jgi:hypothetical protein